MSSTVRPSEYAWMNTAIARRSKSGFTQPRICARPIASACHPAHGIPRCRGSCCCGGRPVPCHLTCVAEAPRRCPIVTILGAQCGITGRAGWHHPVMRYGSACGHLRAGVSRRLARSQPQVAAAPVKSVAAASHPSCDSDEEPVRASSAGLMIGVGVSE